MVQEFKHPIIGQEAICPDGLGRVIAFKDEFPHQWIQVSTYVHDHQCQWAPNNVKLIDPCKSGEMHNRVDPIVIPAEMLDLVRFLAETWNKIDAFVYEYCSGDALMKYPVVQGTRNQMDLRRIGGQQYSKKNLRKAVDWMLKV